MSFSWKDRQTALASLESNPPELLIIGAGIVGASTAAHAAKLGLNVLVIEKEDIAAGASGNSTGLAHAGLRYLAQGRVGYVFHEGRERHRLQDLAPHWVRPFNFILPAYKADPYPFWVMQVGTWIYDLLGWADALLTRRKLVRRHRVLSADEIKARIPGIRSEGLLGGIEYFVDAQLQDARVTLGYAQQAARHGARFITHCEVTAVTTSVDAGVQVVARDLLTGKSLDIRTSLVLNASGAWIDGVRQRAKMAGALVQKSKGIHLVVDHIADSPLIMSGNTKGKVFFVIPVDSECTLVGTTDTPLKETPDEASPDARDVMELLQQLFHFFPYFKQGTHLLDAIDNYRQVHVRDVYWAVRPLLLQQGTSTLDTSREHRLVKDLPRFWSLPGVKLTAGRVAGHDAAVEAWSFLRKGVPLPEVAWDSLPGGELWDLERFVSDAQRRFKLGSDPGALLRSLINAYGTRYVEVLQWTQREAAYSEPIVPGEPWILAEAAYAMHEEMVLTLNDFLWRRTKWAHYRDLPMEAVQRIAQTLGKFLGWSDDDLHREVEAFEKEQKKHRLS
jgi:glycerol-3-phosphate dehydrogenase